VLLPVAQVYPETVGALRKVLCTQVEHVLVLGGVEAEEVALIGRRGRGCFVLCARDAGADLALRAHREQENSRFATFLP